MAGSHGVTCPHCSLRFPVAEEAFGEALGCKGCGSEFRAFSRWFDDLPGESYEKDTALVDWKSGDVVLGIYEVRGILGEGGMGRVYLVHHRGWNMPLAVKVPRPELIHSARSTESFENECRTWINLGIHPQITSCHFVRRFGDVPLAFLEYVDGGSLSQSIREGSLYQGSEKEVLARLFAIAVQSARGLAYAHSKGLIHRDVKPANILLTREGWAKVTDFGIAQLHDSMPKEQGAPERGAMTPAYCSPEQAAGRHLCPKTDMWSWGLSVLEMFKGEMTWLTGQVAAQVLDEYVREGKAAPGAPGNNQQRYSIPRMPAPLVELLASCFQHDVAARPQDMAAIAARVEGLLGHSGVAVELGESVAPVLDGANANNLAISSIELGEHERAEEQLRGAVENLSEISGNESALIRQLASYNYCLHRIRQNPGARLKNVERHIPRLPGAPKQSFLAAMLYLEMGDFLGAIETAEEAIAEDHGDLCEAFNARGIGLLLAGETKPAVLSFRAALHREPERWDILRNLAVAHYYDGNFRLSLHLFDLLSERSVFDEDDCIRYATALSAAGRKGEAQRWLSRALSAKNPSSAVKLSAAELIFGAQTFLPSVCPLNAESTVAQELIAASSKAEPANLRARIDAQTYPSRYGLELGPVIRNRRRVPLAEGSPARIGGCIASSYRTLTRRSCWGAVPGRARRMSLIAVSAILPLCISLALALGIAHGEESRLLVCTLVIFGSSMLLTLRGAPANNLVKESLYLLPVLSLPFLVSLTFPTGEGDVLLRRLLPASGACILLVYVVWQLILQRLTCFVRTFPHRRLVGAFKMRSLRTPEEDLRTGASGGAWSKLSDASRRMQSNTKPAGIKIYRTLLAALRGWFLFLIPQTVATLALFLSDLDGAYMQYLPFISVPLLIAPFSPWLMLVLNSPVSVYVGLVTGAKIIQVYASSTQAMSDAELFEFGDGGLLFSLAMAAVFTYLNWAAIRRCPEFVPEWTTHDAAPWDISQMVDPLDIRRYAAPWQLVQPDVLFREQKRP